MNNSNIFGIKKNSEPLSEAFDLNTINNIIDIDKGIYSINKLILSTSYKYLENFSILNKNYVNLLINIDIRVDYLCELKNINYCISKIEKIISICTDDVKCNKSTPIKFDILDSEIIEKNKSSIHLYILYLVSLDIY